MCARATSWAAGSTHTTLTTAQAQPRKRTIAVSGGSCSHGEVNVHQGCHPHVRGAKAVRRDGSRKGALRACACMATRRSHSHSSRDQPVHAQAAWTSSVVNPAACMRRTFQVELFGTVPPIDKMDATLSTLKACRCAPCSVATTMLQPTGHQSLVQENPKGISLTNGISC